MNHDFVDMPISWSRCDRFIRLMLLDGPRARDQDSWNGDEPASGWAYVRLHRVNRPNIRNRQCASSLLAFPAFLLLGFRLGAAANLSLALPPVRCSLPPLTVRRNGPHVRPREGHVLVGAALRSRRPWLGVER